MNCVTALLPMKGHSERVPNKNIRDFSGKPLFFRVLCELEKARYVENICINTDSDEIAELASSNFNVKIIKRPEHLIGDFVSMNDIIGYDIAQLEGEHFLQTHSTNPLLTAKTIDCAIESYFEHLPKYDSLFSVNRLQTRLYNEHFEAINHDPKVLIRTQDLPPVYEENSNIYLFSRESFLKENKRIGRNPFLIEMDKLEAMDIDEEEDFILALAIYNMKQSGQL